MRIFSRILTISLATFLPNLATASGELTNNDLAILIPNTQSFRGQLPELPQDIFSLEEVHVSIKKSVGAPLESDTTPVSHQLKGFRIVAMRIDACLDCTGSLERADYSVRLVAQPVDGSHNGDRIRFLDAAVHLIYRVEPTHDPKGAREFKNAIHELLRSLAQNGKSPGNNQSTILNVNPTLLEEGPTGPYYTQLNSFIQTWLTKSRLDHFTTMSLGRTGESWIFGKFRWDANGALTASPPQTVTSAAGFNIIGNGLEHQQFPRLNPNEPSAFPPLLLKNMKIKQASTEELYTSLEVLSHLSDPAKVNPSNTSCLACHVAINATARLRMLGKSSLFANFAPLNSLLQQALPESLEGRMGAITRGFGYFDDEPSISAIVVNAVERDLPFIKSQMNEIGKQKESNITTPKNSSYK